MTTHYSQVQSSCAVQNFRPRVNVELCGVGPKRGDYNGEFVEGEFEGE